MFHRKIFNVFLLSFIGLNCFGQGLPEKENDTIIVWTEDRFLTYIDFNRRVFKGEKAAESDIGIDVRSMLNGTNKYVHTVFASFDKRSSSIEVDNDLIIAHEQLHFDIAELFCRKIRKKLREISKVKFNRKQYDSEIDQLYELYFKYQEQYDTETNHSKNFRMQKEWNNKVALEMKKFKAYTSKLYATNKK